MTRVTMGMRWEALGVTGGLFPVLDADIGLTAEGEEGTRMTLNGVYRPPLAALGAGWTGCFYTRLRPRRSIL